MRLPGLGAARQPQHRLPIPKTREVPSLQVLRDGGSPERLGGFGVNFAPLINIKEVNGKAPPLHL